MRHFLFIMSIIFAVGCGSSEEEDTDTTSNSSNSQSSSSETEEQSSDIPKIVAFGLIQESMDSSGNLKLFGEVKNIGPATGVFIRAKCVYYGDSSNVIGDDFSYIIGTVLTLDSIQTNTNTALKSRETGFFEIYGSVKKSEIDRYSCDYTYDIGEISNPRAKLEIVGDVTIKERSSGLEILGSVKNSGSEGLKFGELYFVIRNSLSQIVDIDFTYIDGETIILSSINSTIDTALDAGRTGTFSMLSFVPYNSYASHIVRYDWDDLSDGSTSSARFKSLDRKSKWKLRNQQIDDLRQSLYDN